jgi:hypothetical protein
MAELLLVKIPQGELRGTGSKGVCSLFSFLHIPFSAPLGPRAKKLSAPWSGTVLTIEMLQKYIIPTSPTLVTYLCRKSKRWYEFEANMHCKYHGFMNFFFAFRSALRKNGENTSPMFQISVRGKNIVATRF